MPQCYSILVILSCFLIFSCETPPPSEDGSSVDGKINYTYLAEKFCVCAQTSIELNAELEELKIANKIDQLIDRLPQAEKTFKEVVDCCENILLNHSKEKLQPRKMNKVLEQKCEKLAPRLRTDLIQKMPR